MSQMEASIKMMVMGLEGMTKNLENLVTDTYSKMSPEQALQFAKELQKNKVESSINDATKQINDLKNSLKID